MLHLVDLSFNLREILLMYARRPTDSMYKCIMNQILTF